MVHYREVAMPVLSIFGIILVGIVALLLPRLILAIVAGAVLGFNPFFIIILAIIGLVIDIGALN
jgi:hypothetical protein